MITQYSDQKEKARAFYEKIKSVSCPFFEQEVIFNMDGFHHLRYSARSERPKQEQILKFTLLPLAVEIIKRSGTHQEYRRGITRVGAESKGFSLMKKIEYWGFIAIMGKNKIKVRVIVKRTGDGNYVFWSVMPAMKLIQKEDEYERLQRLAGEAMEEA